MKAGWLALVPFLALFGNCSSKPPERPPGPPPEYERAPLPPWDAGAGQRPQAPAVEAETPTPASSASGAGDAAPP